MKMFLKEISEKIYICGDPDEEPELQEDNIDNDQALLMILTFVLRHKLMGEALQYLILLNQFIPGLAPVTKYHFSK